MLDQVLQHLKNCDIHKMFNLYFNVAGGTYFTICFIQLASTVTSQQEANQVPGEPQEAPNLYRFIKK